MKTVFNNSQVAHIWANGSQSHGRNSTGSFYFEGDKIYSYGSHYLAGQIYTPTKDQFMGHNYKKVYLINDHNYSPSTAKHLNHIFHAIDKKTHLWLSVEKPDNPKESLIIKQKELIDNFFKYFSEIKPSQYFADSDSWFFGIVERFNQVCEFFGYDLKLNFDCFKDVIKEHYLYRQKRYEELNTPEAIEKREKEREKREERKRLKAIKDYEEKIRQWKSFETNQNLYSLNTIFLRVKDNEIQTSKGASVPLSHGLRILDLVLKRQAKPGERVGLFTLEDYNETTVKIGCHTINIKEAIETLEPYKNKVQQ